MIYEVQRVILRKKVENASGNHNECKQRMKKNPNYPHTYTPDTHTHTSIINDKYNRTEHVWDESINTLKCFR